MTLSVNGRDVDIIGYDEYLRDYEDIVKDEYKKDAEAELITILESFDIRHENGVCIYISSENVRMNRDAMLFFDLGIGYIQYSGYVYENPESGKRISYRLTELWKDGGYITSVVSDMCQWLERKKETREFVSEFLEWSKTAEIGDIFEIGRILIEVIED